MTEQPSMIVRGDHPLIGVPVRQDGEDMIRYVADEKDLEKSPGQTSVDKALALAGAWSDLDFDEMLDALDRIRHESKPTPPSEPQGERPQEAAIIHRRASRNGTKNSGP